jgi:HAE1 family hydrophobic/amphiphilic exporter-1
MAIGIGEGAEIRRPMAITVIAGTLVATFLTLIVIPVLYAVLDRKQFVKSPASTPGALATPVTPALALRKSED